MTELVTALLEQLKSKEYRKLRQSDEAPPIIFPVDMFGFHFGSNVILPSCGGNWTPDYPRVLRDGFDGIAAHIRASRAAHPEPDKQAYADEMLAYMDDMLAMVDTHRALAKERCPRLYEALGVVPRRAPQTFYQACVVMKCVIYILRHHGVNHLGLGRFDQYMYPFWQADLANGVSEEELFETLEAFFISLNYDTDVYFGIQVGDNGQSMVLGGFDAQGNDQFNALSRKCLEASLELNLIDPKINLRVGKKTPDDVLILGTQLTKKGLGFPQYCNDDVVVPGLIKLGYDEEDAYNYVVAACWEYIIPGVGADVPNIATMEFPLVIRRAVDDHLMECNTFEQLLGWVDRYIADVCDEFVEREKNRRIHLPHIPSSIFAGCCIDRLCDLYGGGAKYYNFGSHGAGIANGADALSAIKTCVFDEKTMTKEALMAALKANFEGFETVRNQLKACPKMGQNHDVADDLAAFLMRSFGAHLNNRPNGHGGIWRAGTGSAMDYYLKARNCPATPDGRQDGDMYPCSFSPSMEVKGLGILSVIQSFTKYDMTEIINGGPLTLEIHDTVLRNDIGIEKTAQLVRLFIERGGHQLQLNSINREVLLDAQKHPEQYPNLIVRVWGWSGYFNELDLPYQEHIIRRTHHMF